MSKFRLTAKAKRRLAPFFTEWLLNKVIIHEHPKHWPPFYATMRDDGSFAPAFVVGKTIHMLEGMYGRPVRIWGNTFDLDTVEGIVTLGHECGHVKQYVERGFWWMFFAIIRGGLMSMAKRRLWWSHEIAEVEQELIKGQDVTIMEYWQKRL
ncbi:MAG: hypothetical protein ACYSWU_17730 [Planctomycetota bacterium]|jgi:hypothetical protein